MPRRCWQSPTVAPAQRAQRGQQACVRQRGSQQPAKLEFHLRCSARLDAARHAAMWLPTGHAQPHSICRCVGEQAATSNSSMPGARSCGHSKPSQPTCGSTRCRCSCSPTDAVWFMQLSGLLPAAGCHGNQCVRARWGGVIEVQWRPHMAGAGSWDGAGGLLAVTVAQRAQRCTQSSSARRCRRL